MKPTARSDGQVLFQRAKSLTCRDPRRTSTKTSQRNFNRGCASSGQSSRASSSLIVALAVAAGLREGWSLQESVYFSFVSGLTIGYGDFAPKTLLGRAIAIAIGVCGVLVTALVAAVVVKALTATTVRSDE